ncbi:heparan sulfate 2-O-sulfotransferase 1-like isoform X2 [Gordionus sp. m RMFG-2023]
MHIIYKMSRVNNFNVVYLNTSFKRNLLTPMDQILLANNITSWIPDKSFVYHGHFSYFNIEKLGSKGDIRNVVYVNVLREPFNRLVSYYYFLRFGDDYRPHLKRHKMGDNKTLDECVAENGSECDAKMMWIQIPYFCGHFSFCHQPGNELALQQAKLNLVNKYFLVGTLERLKDFVELLEHSLPTVFDGAMSMFQEASLLSISKRKTSYKKEPSLSTTKLLKSNSIYLMEKEFYEFASQIFDYFYQTSMKYSHKPINLNDVYQKIYIG